MSAPSSRAEARDATSRLRRLAQGGYALQALSIGLGVLGDGIIVTAFIVVLPALGGYAIARLQRGAARGTALEPHFAWQRRSLRIGALGMLVATLLLGPLLFIGLSLLWYAYALIGLWLAWRVGRGAWSLLKTLPLPGTQPAVTRSGSDA